MMYHFMFGLRGASVGAAAPSTGVDGVLSPPVGVSFFSSSCIWGVSSFTSRTDVISTTRLEHTEQIAHAVLDQEVDHPEIEGENSNRDDHHRGRPLHFLQRGRGHLAHFVAHVVVEGLDPLGPGSDLVAEAAAGCCN